MFIPSLTERNSPQKERDLLARPVRMGGLGLTNTVQTARSEYSASIEVSAPLADKIMAQSHENPEDANLQTLINEVRKGKGRWSKTETRGGEELYPTKGKKSNRPVTRKGCFQLAHSNPL